VPCAPGAKFRLHATLAGLLTTGYWIRSGRAAAGAAQRQQHIRPKLMATSMTSHRQLQHDHQLDPALVSSSSFRFIGRKRTMMSISGFACQIGAVSNFSGTTIKAARRAMQTASVTLLSDFDTCFQNLFSFQLLMSRQKVLGTTGARFG
jgi:hypothetical protein